MESYRFLPNEMYDDPNLTIYHGQNFLKYRYHGMNVGAFGLSPHTELKDPLIIPYRSLKASRSRTLF